MARRVDLVDGPHLLLRKCRHGRLLFEKSSPVTYKFKLFTQGIAHVQSTYFAVHFLYLLMESIYNAD